MTQQPIPEILVAEHLSLCLAAMQDCLAQSRQSRDNDEYGHQRRNDLAYVAKLMKASARLTTALAKLKGDNRMSIHVTRGGENALVDKRARLAFVGEQGELTKAGATPPVPVHRRGV